MDKKRQIEKLKKELDKVVMQNKGVSDNDQSLAKGFLERTYGKIS